MVARRLIEFLVGLFMIAGVIAVFILALQVSSFSKFSNRNAYHVVAAFENIGDLKVRAPVTIAGVRVGEVQKITMDSATFNAKVTLLIDNKQNGLPTDSSASILTAGLIGANYIGITPGFSGEMLKEGGVITETHPAIILERLIGQMVYQLKGDKGESGDNGNKNNKRESGDK